MKISIGTKNFKYSVERVDASFVVTAQVNDMFSFDTSVSMTITDSTIKEIALIPRRECNAFGLMKALAFEVSVTSPQHPGKAGSATFNGGIIKYYGDVELFAPIPKKGVEFNLLEEFEEIIKFIRSLDL